MKINIIGCLSLAVMACISAFVSPSSGSDDYVGVETCMECHEQISEIYLNSRHGVKVDPRSPAAKLGCESCHGPGNTHAEEGDGLNILSFAADSTTQVEIQNGACLACHDKSYTAFWAGSGHETRGLTCASCHRVHAGHPKGLSEPTQSEVCTACHKQIRAELMRQSHHPIREGKMKCTDCHNPHGSIGDKLVAGQSTNLKCFECHAEKRGPFLWEHPPVVEGCLTCHTSHGSVRNWLLTAKMPYLCQRCHSNSGHQSGLYARKSTEADQPVYRVLNNRAFYRACGNCHAAVHGSNHPSGKGLLR